jgi:hypothetical protein
MVNLFIFPAKEKITAASGLSDFAGQMVKITDNTLAFEDTGLSIKLNGEMPGYQWVQHLSGKSGIYITSIGGEKIPVVSKKVPGKGIYKVVQIDKSSEEWGSLDLFTLENEYQINTGGGVLIYQKNQLSITLFIVAGLIFLILIFLVILRTNQLTKWMKENPEEYDAYERNLLNNRGW